MLRFISLYRGSLNKCCYIYLYRGSLNKCCDCTLSWTNQTIVRIQEWRSGLWGWRGRIKIYLLCSDGVACPCGQRSLQAQMAAAAAVRVGCCSVFTVSRLPPRSNTMNSWSTPNSLWNGPHPTHIVHAWSLKASLVTVLFVTASSYLQNHS
jgi:hypothetical protein